MENLPPQIRDFLIRAKRATYAAKGQESPPTRPGAHDLRYEEGDFQYLDSFVGSEQFAGEETVFHGGHPIWAMNYCGRVTGEGFDGDFLKAALMRVPEDAPFRGPIEYQDGAFLYCNTCAGDPRWFFGREEIYRSGVSIFECVYHGGAIG